MVKVVRDEGQNLIKVVDVPEAKVSSKFGTSLLYEYQGYYFHPRAYEVLCKLDKLKFRRDDVILTMFPKSGSTWLSECIYLIVNEYNYELASSDSIELRFPQIDSPSHDVFELIMSKYEDLTCTRLVKSSIPPNLLIKPTLPAGGNDCDQKTARITSVSANDTDAHFDIKAWGQSPLVVSIFRNPRDVLVSFYHHCKTVKHYDLHDFTFDRFFESFVSDQVPCGPIWKLYNDSYKYHLDNPQTSLVVFYEDMKSNLSGQIERICKFLCKPTPHNKHEWQQLLSHLSVDKMRQNRTINRHDWTQLGLKNANGYEFVRKGQVNDWRNFFSQKQSLEFDFKVTSKLVPALQKVYGAQEY